MTTIAETVAELPTVHSYLQRIGAEPRSMRRAVVKEVAGAYWRDVAVIRFGTDGAVEAPEEYAPTESERMRIAEEIAAARFPRLVVSATMLPLPPEVAAAEPADRYEFRDSAGQLLMLQVRSERRCGEKAYKPWTQWDDGRWRQCEPDGPLPLWGLDRLGAHTTVFIHEGAKAARAIAEMVAGETPAARAALDAHPWGEELAGAAHLGWIGGALSPMRTDWGVLKRAGVKRAYIVSDNDSPGLAAVPGIAQRLDMITFHVQFTDEWPPGYDLADEFPEHFFRTLGEARNYIGPSFAACVHPATWATNQVAVPGTKRPVSVLREHFKDLWAYVEEADVFVCTEMPQIVRSEAVLDKMLAPFSHVLKTSTLIAKAYRGRQVHLAYRPDSSDRIITKRDSTTAINLHTPTMIPARAGDATPWLEFLEYMFPNHEEREEVARWCATLIGAPGNKMEYGLLLVSESTGVGKTTIAASVLAPLVGGHNVGWPSESEIVNSDFNGWIANRRLVVVNEIYSGHSWRAYHKLKSMITDREISVNQKYRPQYVVENWAHIVANSNSLRALKMEQDDRRWYYPEVTEAKWPRERFARFHEWLESGGLSIVRGWAERFHNYILPGEHAPMTRRKRELIRGSRSEAQTEAAVMAEALCGREGPAGLAMKELVAAVRAEVQGRVADTDYELRKAAVESGAQVWPTRIKISGRMQYVLCNAAMWAEATAAPEPEQPHRLRERLVRPAELFETSM